MLNVAVKILMQLRVTKLMNDISVNHKCFMKSNGMLAMQATMVTLNTTSFKKYRALRPIRLRSMYKRALRQHTEREMATNNTVSGIPPNLSRK